MANWIARKSDRSLGLGWIVYWDLFDENNNYIGEILRNGPNKVWNVTVYSRQTGLIIESKMFPDTKPESRQEALAWARETVENEPPITKEQLEELIKMLKHNKYMDEMSDDFAYSNGKVDRWNKEIKRLENMYKTFN